MNRVRVNLHGPFFSAPLRRATMASLKNGILKSVTQFAFDAVSSILSMRIQNPTPVYQTLIRIDDRLGDRWRVTDQGKVVYNHWLEGDGSRNYPVTSFRGYHAFGLAYQFTERQAARLADAEVRKALKRMGG